MDGYENLSCLLSKGNSRQKSEKTVKRPGFLLFGQPILTEQQISDCSKDEISNLSTQKSSLGQTPLNAESLALDRHSIPESFGLNAGHCKVFLESENVDRTLDLSLLGSYKELYKRLENLFGIERSEMLSHVFYHDAAGAVKEAGEEPFRKLITGLPGSECGLESSKPTGPLSIFA